MKKGVMFTLIIFSCSLQVFSQTWSIQYTDQSQTKLISTSVVNNKVAWVCGFNGLVLRTTDGENWQEVSLPGNLDSYCIEALSGDTAFVGVNPSPNICRIYETTDGGVSWSPEYESNSFVNAIHFYNDLWGTAIIDPVPDIVSYFIFANTYDGGEQWISNVVTCLDGETGFDNCAFFMGSHGWFGTSKGRIFKTSNQGGEWLPLNLVFDSSAVGSIALISDSVGIVFIKSPNYGYWIITKDSWNSVQEVAPSGVIWLGRSVAAVPELKQFWVCGSYSQPEANSIFTTKDSGNTFIQQTVDEIQYGSSIYYMELKMYNDSLFGVAVTNKGQILGYHEFVTSSIKESKPELSYKLYPNYPNPFNPVTNIRYSIPHQSKVTLKIYDILGKEIAILVDEEKTSGSYELSWNATSAEGGLPSGVYFYRLQATPVGGQAGNFVETKKMILLK